MKITDMIAMLEKAKEEHGDLECVKSGALQCPTHTKIPYPALYITRDIKGEKLLGISL